MLVPTPTRLTRGDGSFRLDVHTAVAADDVAAPVGDLLRELLTTPTGLPLPPAAGDSAEIELRVGDDRDDLGDEGYELIVTPDGVRAVAATPAGLRWAVQTMRQLLPADVYSTAPVAGVAWELPAVKIVDVPRFSWRGTMLDVGRWYMPTSFLYRFVDLAAMHKLNVVHLHLTEDQGWRFESKRHPRLTEVGAWRAQSMSGHYQEFRFDGEPYGGFYTQDELRDLVAFAARRGVAIVPEIDMPGHMRAAIAAYPELGNRPEIPIDVAITWGVHPQVLNIEEATVAFCRDVLDEVMDVFPGQFIHIGGDEAPKTEWERAPGAQQRKRQLGLSTEDEMQSWFVRQMSDHLTSRGRRLVGWDEILEGGLAPGATVMSWRGEEGGVQAARAGHDVVMAPNERVYFDHYQSDPLAEPVAIGGLTTLESVLDYEPVPADLDADTAPHVLGAQCQLWTEYMRTPEAVEYMAYPRTAAFADVVWGSPHRDPADFIAELPSHLRRLDVLGVNYRPFGL